MGKSGVYLNQKGEMWGIEADLKKTKNQTKTKTPRKQKTKERKTEKKQKQKTFFKIKMFFLEKGMGMLQKPGQTISCQNSKKKIKAKKGSDCFKKRQSASS